MSEPTLPLDPRRYDDGGLLATGGAATVRLLHDRTLDRPVAVKLASSEAPEDLARFRREARITAQLDHPGVIPIHDLGPDWFTMKRVQGVTYGDMLRHEPDPIAAVGRVIESLLRLCETLAFAHHRKIVHRDLKPENVMIGAFGQVYLVDWGIAQIDGSTDVPYAGTPGWAAPEQARGEVCDPRTDVWGVGGLLYYALSGRKPNGSLSLEERGKVGEGAHPVPLPLGIPGRPAPPPELVRIAMRALSLTPGERYGDTMAMGADLHAARAEGVWFERRTYDVGSDIVVQGAEADEAFFIVEGECEVCQNGGPIASLGAGESFGESALVAAGLRTATVTAATPVTVRVITRGSLDAELHRGGWMGTLARNLAARCVELQRDLAKRPG
jgi:eukaryotic-like serine/threonine-protein kinase